MENGAFSLTTSVLTVGKNERSLSVVSMTVHYLLELDLQRSKTVVASAL